MYALRKVVDRSIADLFSAFPFSALSAALVNATGKDIARSLSRFRA